MKRIFDILTSSIAIFCLSPVILITALLVRLKLGSPVIFCQARPGLNKKSFNIYKFRTMTNSRDAEGTLLPDAQRLTRFGHFLRSTSLDELPALWNVFKGDMSIVGPRPLLEQYLPYYRDEELIRFNVRPGITGLAQISGRNFLNWDDRLMKDIEYVKNRNVFLDLKVIMKTAWKVIKRQDIATDTDKVESFLDEERRNIKN